MQTIEKQNLLERVDRALDAVRPHLAIDGGDVEIVEISEDFIVKIKWLGNCQGCNMTEMTLRAGIEDTVRSRIPEIVGVEEWKEIDA